ncbi:MAG: hypothetical protein HQL63_00015 [Magnetococcales bacterium]|nr:hypothetical protein [Magnetococcales bacterium]
MAHRYPSSPPRNNPAWKPYVGFSSVFHCGYEGYLESHHPTPENPIAECFYDEKGKLVDDHHPYAGCRGSADQYPASDLKHTTEDRGGIAEVGLPAFKEPVKHFLDEVDATLKQNQRKIELIERYNRKK